MSQPALDLRSIFGQALEYLTSDARDHFLDEACGGDADLRREVVSLLQAHQGVGNFLETAAFPAATLPTLPGVEGPGSVVGPYKLLEQIGEGGMGIVYMAEQEHPIRRKVALKIIKPGMDTRQVIARFEAERQALALMDHPNIARVLDAGTTDAGRPYFVMELVKGEPITKYCDEARLNPRERLELVVPVCLALQHAHQKGIIHRDVKPSNVLVALYDGVPVPKVIDFGVAKAVDQRLTERTLYTQHRAIVGTLEYMSPEQAENSSLDVDTRTDVYSLGILFYELITGTTPLQRLRPPHGGYEEVVRRICDEEAPRLSTRLSSTKGLASISARRNTDPTRLARLVRGDLEWIAMKAIEKDRTRRYATAGDLARDIRHYLAGEPVEAVPPSKAYRARKYAKRHRAGLAIASAFAALLVAATAVSVGLAVHAIREGTRARQSAEVEKAVVGFFRDKVVSAARPKDQAGGRGREVTLREALDAAEPEIAADFASRPVVEAAIRDALATSYLYLGDSGPAIRQYERALALRTATLGPDHEDTLDTMNNLAEAYRAAGRVSDAVSLHERGLGLAQGRLGPDHPMTLRSLSNLASAYRLDGSNDQAIPLLERVLALRQSRLGPDHPDTLISTGKLAAAYLAAGRVDEAIPLLVRDLGRSRATLGPDHPDTLTALNNLAGAHVQAGRVKVALPLLVEVVKLRRSNLGADHPDTLSSMNNLAAAYQLDGRNPEAVALFEDVLAFQKVKPGPDHPDTLRTMSNLAMARHVAGQTAEAVPLLEEVLAKRKIKLGPGHPDTLKTMNNLAEIDLETGRWAEAEGVLRDCLGRRRKDQPDDWQRYHTMSQLGAALVGRGKLDDAEPLLIGGYEGLAVREAKVPARSKRYVTAAASRIVAFYKARGKTEKVAEWRSRLTMPADSTSSKP